MIFLCATFPRQIIDETTNIVEKFLVKEGQILTRVFFLQKCVSHPVGFLCNVIGKLKSFERAGV